jgi:hypothetical protein
LRDQIYQQTIDVFGLIFGEIEVNGVDYVVQADAAIEGREMEPGLEVRSLQFWASLWVMCKVNLLK